MRSSVTTLNPAAPNWDWQQTWTSDLLPAGEHTLRLVLTSGSFISARCAGGDHQPGDSQQWAV